MKSLYVLVLALLVGVASAAPQASKEKLPSYPVAPLGDTILVVHRGVGPLNVRERALLIDKRLVKAAKDNITDPHTVTIVKNEAWYELYFGDALLMTITPKDAQLEKTTTLALAKRDRELLASWIEEYRQGHEMSDIIKSILLGLLVTAALVVLIILLNKGKRWLDRKAETWKGTHIKGIKVKDLQLVDTDNELKVARVLINGLRYLLILVVVYIYLPVLFSLFPFTHRMAGKLFGYVIDPIKKIGLSIVDYVPNLITVLIIWLVFRYIIRMLAYFTNEVREGRITIGGFYPDWARTTFSIVRFLLYAFMFVILFPYLPGSDSPIFKGVSVFIGLLISIGSSTIINNLMAGIVVTYMRAFRVNEYVKIGDVKGVITEKSIFVVKLRTFKNEEITIPNSTILSSQTLNYSVMAADGRLILYTSVTIGYDAPWRTVHQLLLDAALATPNVLHDPPPYVLQTSLDDFYVSYQINAYTSDAAKQPATYSALHGNIQDKFNEAGVEIMSPHFKQLRDGNESTIPSSYRPNGEGVGAFRVNVNKGESA